MKNMKMIVMLAVAVNFVVVSAMAQVVAAWDFGDVRQPGLGAPGWTTVSASNMVSFGSTIGDISINLTGGSLDIPASVAQLDTVVTFVEDGPPLQSVSANTAFDQRVYEDWFGDVRRDDPTYTISGLTAGEDYVIQWLGTFNDEGKQITVAQDGVTQSPMTLDGNSAIGTMVYSVHYSFTATGGDTDVDFTFDGATTGGAPKYGLSGLVIAIPEPATSGLLAFAGVAMMLIRRRNG